MDALRLATLFCPHCSKQHVDRGKWALFNHKTHICVDGCGRRFEDPKGPSVGIPHETSRGCGKQVGNSIHACGEKGYWHLECAFAKRPEAS